jgi:hypothetical protein
VELHLSRSRLRALMRGAAFRGVSRIAADLERAARSGEFLVVGTPGYEPWHLVAHWQQSPVRVMSPTLVRHHVAANAAPHLSIGLDAIQHATRTDALLIVAPDRAGADLLERLSDARRRGATVLALTADDDETTLPEFDSIAHDLATVGTASFDFAQHLLPIATQVQ